MLIADIVPYERNARDNKKAVRPVAESIKAYGLRGTIGLRSRENPVIVYGHTRVEACKSLGWTEIPDEKIDWCDDLTDEEVDEFRIADNKTGDIATYNRAMLREEVRRLTNFDTKKFGFEFKSKHLEYGHERWKNNNGWNLDLVSRADCAGELELPPLLPVDVEPDDFISFNFCKSAKEFDCGVHFCIDDYQFNRVWNSPKQYVDLLKQFQCVVTPDFSVYDDMPYPMRLWGIYKALAIGLYWQREGMKVVPNITANDMDFLELVLPYYPKGGTIFFSTMGVTRDKGMAKIARKEMERTEQVLEPSRVLLFGDPLGYEWGCECKVYKARSWHDKGR